MGYKWLGISPVVNFGDKFPVCLLGIAKIYYPGKTFGNLDKLKRQIAFLLSSVSI